MTPQEQQLLQDFLTQLVEVKGIAKDPAADALIAQALAKQPDAAYLLVQRSLLVGNALTEAQAQIARLEAQVQAARPAQSAGGFLDASSWGRRGAQTASSPTAAATSLTGTPLGGPARGMTPAAAMAATPQPAARSGFLGNMAATAAGVVGGAFLFQGLSHMMNSDSASQSAQNQPATLDSTPLPPTSTAATGTGHDGYDGGSSSYDMASYDTSNDAGSGDESSGDA
jgi:uncharacterized protein